MEIEEGMRTYRVGYTRIPTNYHDRRFAEVVAGDAADARSLVINALGGDSHNYVIDPAFEYEEPKVAGRILSM